MPSCIVCGRTKNKNSKSNNISFHRYEYFKMFRHLKIKCNVYFRFPFKDYVSKKWDNFLIENYLNPKNVTKYSVICSLHFDKSCFVIKQSKKLLQKHVFPSIVVRRIKSVSLQLLQ